MTSSINLWDSDIWNFVLTLCILFIAIFVANAIRNSCSHIRRLMIPSAVLGGFILLLINEGVKLFTGDSIYSYVTMEQLTYHGLGLGFAALALCKNNKDNKDGSTPTAAFDTGVTVAGGYILQGIVGLIISISLYYLIHSFFASGLLLPMGYGQGPGQAYNWGHNYETIYGFENGTSFGLTIAAMGFISASIGGIIYLNWLRHKGIIKDDNINKFADEEQLSTYVYKNEIHLTDGIDKFTIQLALVLIAYACAYLFMRGITKLVEPTFLYETALGIIWGFQFLFSSLFATLIKVILKKLRAKNIVHHEYINDFMQSRISGVMFDVMVVSSIAAINLSAFRYASFLLPLILICVFGAVCTFIYLKFVCKHIFKEYEHEAFLSLYGMQTGTASTGVILLREIDPQYKTPASSNIVYHLPWAVVFAAPMFLLMGVGPQSIGKCFMVFGIYVALFILICLILFRKYIFKTKS